LIATSPLAKASHILISPDVESGSGSEPIGAISSFPAFIGNAQKIIIVTMARANDVVIELRDCKCLPPNERKRA
jgi:hypothetical protein